jgi:hypothetical protein
MAAGLATAIENKFGLKAELIQGHDGIYEIAVNGKLVYSNQACDHAPVEEEVFAEISRYQNPRPEMPRVDDAPVDGPNTDVPFCAWSPPTTKKERQLKKQREFSKQYKPEQADDVPRRQHWRGQNYAGPDD